MRRRACRTTLPPIQHASRPSSEAGDQGRDPPPHDAVRGCYEELLTGEHRPEGRVVLRFIIASDGHVQEPTVTESQIPDDRLHGCLLGVVRRMSFPEPDGGGCGVVNYPFHFTLAEGEPRDPAASASESETSAQPVPLESLPEGFAHERGSATSVGRCLRRNDRRTARREMACGWTWGTRRALRSRGGPWRQQVEGAFQAERGGVGAQRVECLSNPHRTLAVRELEHDDGGAASVAKARTGM